MCGRKTLGVRVDERSDRTGFSPPWEAVKEFRHFIEADLVYLDNVHHARARYVLALRRGLDVVLESRGTRSLLIAMLSSSQDVGGRIGKSSIESTRLLTFYFWHIDMPLSQGEPSFFFFSVAPRRRF